MIEEVEKEDGEGAIDEFGFAYSNGFRLPHLSPSTVNSFITDRFGFYNSKMLGAPFKGNAFTARGTAVEHSINVWIETGSTDVVEHALLKYDEELVNSGTHRIAGEEVRETIPGLAKLALKTYSQIFTDGNKPITQNRVGQAYPGLKRELMGYTDFLVSGKEVRDCKVTGRSPSKLSQNYILQGAFYRSVTGLPVVFDFFIPNKTPVVKHIWLSDDEYEFGLSYLLVASKVIEELQECSDPKRIIHLMSFPNLDALWNTPDKRAAAKQWGIAYK